MLKLAAKVSAFAAELKVLGPVKGARALVGWVESGLLRKTGLHRADFPSLFGLAADVELTFDPPWTHAMMSDVAKLETGML